MKLTNAIMNNLGHSEADPELYLTEMLDEGQPDIEVAGLTFSPSQIVKELDPVAWRCMISDLEEFEEIDGTTYHVDAIEEAQESLDELVEAVELAQEELEAAIEEATTIEEARSALEQAQAALNEITGA